MIFNAKTTSIYVYPLCYAIAWYAFICHTMSRLSCLSIYCANVMCDWKPSICRVFVLPQKFESRSAVEFIIALYGWLILKINLVRHFEHSLLSRTVRYRICIMDKQRFHCFFKQTWRCSSFRSNGAHVLWYWQTDLSSRDRYFAS